MPRDLIRQGGLLAVLATLVTAGCAGPLDRTEEQALRASVINAHRARLQRAAPGDVVELERAPSEVEQELSSERRQQLDQMSGPEAYQQESMELGENLQGSEQVRTVKLALEQAIRMAVKHNLDVQTARLAPAIAETQVTQAQARFDATFFTTANWEKRDTPRPGGFVQGFAGNQQSETFNLTTGIRKPLVTGGQARVQTTLNRQFQDPTTFAVNRFYNADVLVGLEQPLLRNFGRDVNTAEIRLAQNARADQRQELVRNLLEVAFNTEQAYWQLVLRRHELKVFTRLLERTQKDRARLKERAGFDVSPVQLTQANSFLEQRRSQVIRARLRVRQASDQLKQLINAPGLPVAGETLVLPSEDPTHAPLKFSLRDAVRTALRHRPALQQALLAIKDASIRQRVADNARLPLLNLRAELAANGLGIDSGEDAYDQLDELNFIDYVLGAEFELPIGNRERRARYQQRKLERRQAVTRYRRTAQQAVLDVKNALRNVLTAYELIGATRATRRAAADNLRALQEQEEAGVALTPEFLLDLKLQTQRRLAEAEIEEMRAMTDYMTAIAELYRQMGTLLDRNQIQFANAETPAHQ